MKVIYEFDAYEDKEELEIYQQACKLHSLVWEFTHNNKHRLANLAPELQPGYEKALDVFFEMMRDYGVTCE